MSGQVNLSVVVPAYNEERRLPATLERIAGYLGARPSLLPAEIIVVDDGSSDRTAAVAEASPATPGVAVRVLRLGRNRGKGAGVRAGLAASRGGWVLISDADLATPVEEVEALLASGADLAVGSRALRRELIARRQPAARDAMGRVFNLTLRALGLTRLSDTQCGFKLVEGSLARRLAATMRLDGFAFDVELLARAARAGATIAEVPVRWRHVEASRVRPLRHGAQMLRDAIRIRLWLWCGR
ncbi:MAG: glycosyltransferase family 2 protein [Thermoanaerobaculaceae bacterium]|nr:glycosyltransferase family 2 protein [Thermoanaerobaculaceae bacterium]TAM50768.1 MAG: glycosyltransferase family 2 protein [Acidobacteriota bacterium]